MGYLTDDERLVLTGREKDLIVRSGHNIDPAAIEDVANALPGVEISAAVGMPDQYAGEVPVLFVVPRDGQAFDLAALHQQLEDGLHEPPARPRRILQIDALPVTAVGKIFKPALRDLAIAEKLRLEVAEHCSPGASVDVRVTQDAQKRLCVQALVADADAEGQAALAQALADRFGDHPNVGDIRGRGMFRGIELVADRDTKAPFDPDLGVAAKLKKAAFANGLICYPMGGTIDGRLGDHILLAPPFIITDDQIAELVDKLSTAMDQVL